MYNLERNVLLMTFRASDPERRNPSDQELEDFDAGLAGKYFGELARQTRNYGIPLNRFTGSMLVFFATQSTADTPAVKVQHACEYFNSVRPHQAEPEPRSFGAGVLAITDGGSTPAE